MPWATRTPSPTPPSRCPAPTPRSQAPSGGNRVGALQDAAKAAGAEEGAADLRRFVAGLRTSHQGEPTHLTVAGHGYGCTVVGAAASGGGLGADDIIALGSPGMTVDTAAELNIDPDHVWVGQAEDDVIDWVDNLTLGKDPSERGFGGKNIAIDTSGHNGYWESGSQSLANQGRIIAGKQPTTVPKERDDWPFVPFW